MSFPKRVRGGEKKMEKDLMVEEIRFGLLSISFEKLTKCIPKIEEGKRVKVFFEGTKYFPATQTGEELALAYKTVGFSFIPAWVVEKPLPQERPPAGTLKTYAETLQEHLRELRNLERRDPPRGWFQFDEQALNVGQAPPIEREEEEERF